jgi:hypothetical protein
MAKVEILTLSTLFQLFSVNGLYVLGYAWLFGMCMSPLTMKQTTAP